LPHVGDVRNAPYTLFAGDASEIDRSVGQARRGLRRSGHAAAATAAGGRRLRARLLGADREERREENRDERAEHGSTQKRSHDSSPWPEIDEPAGTFSGQACRSGSTPQTAAGWSPRG